MAAALRQTRVPTATTSALTRRLWTNVPGPRVSLHPDAPKGRRIPLTVALPDDAHQSVDVNAKDVRRVLPHMLHGCLF